MTLADVPIRGKFRFIHLYSQQCSCVIQRMADRRDGSPAVRVLYPCKLHERSANRKSSKLMCAASDYLVKLAVDPILDVLERKKL